MTPQSKNMIIPWISVFLISSAPTLQAQIVDPADQSEVIELSPFEVDGSGDIGYQASSTLAGTRIATDLRDIGASVSVITREFLDDLGATDTEDLLVYTANTEVGGVGGNFSGATQETGGYSTLGQRLEPQRATRVRGLSQADLTRNFFVSDIPFDSFNIDRVAINRGPNAALFGLGSPGGVINSSLKSALMVDRTEMTLSYGSFGTHRETLDINREIIERKLALRVNTLFEKEKFEQDPAFERDQRVHAEILFRPWEDTTLRVNAESGSIKANRPRTMPPVDAFTSWWDGGKPTHAGEEDVRPDLANEWLISAFNVFFQPVTLYDDHTSSEPATDPGDAITTWWPNRFSGSTGIFFARLGSAPVRWQAGGFGNPARFDARTGVAGSSSFFTNDVITDRGIFDYRKQLIDGPNKFENQSFDTINFTLEQRLFDDRFGVELAYDRQNYKSIGSDSFSIERSQLLSVDVTTTLYDGTPNPHFGRPYISSPEGEDFRYTEREALRATAFYKLNASDLFDGEKSDFWFGRHNFTGFFNRQNIEQTNGGWWTIYSPEHYQRMGDSSLNVRGGVQVRAGTYSYLGESVANLADPTDAHVPNLQAVQGARPVQNGFLWNPDSEQWERGQTNGLERVLDSYHVGIDEIDSTVFVWQGFFANDKIVPTFSWRKDEVDNFQASAPAGPRNELFPDQLVLPSTPGISAQTQIRSWSLVGHSPDFINRRLPFDSDLSVHYIKAENFQVSEAATNMIGESLAFPTGQTEEFGFTVNALGGKVVARVNFFETKQSNQRISVPSLLLFGTIDNVLRENTPAEIAAAGFIPPWEDPAMPEKFRVMMRDTYNVTQIGTHPNGNPDYEFSTDNTVSSTRQLVTDGMEVEIAANPTPNWRVAFNVSQQNSGQSDSALLNREYIEARRDVWFTGATSQLQAEPTGGTLADLARRRFLNPFLVATAQDGGAVQELREWRWNLVTNYKFANSELPWLRGLGVGGAVRWQDDISIGFPVKLEEGTTVPDVDNAFFGDPETGVDLWFTYEGTAWRDKMDWTLRLGIKNLSSGEGLVPLSAQPDGTFAYYRIEAPRTFELSLRLRL